MHSDHRLFISFFLFLRFGSGMLSCQQTQNIIDGKKRIILNPNETQKRDFESATFAEGEVYGIDILVSSGEGGKVCFLKLPPSVVIWPNITCRQGSCRRVSDNYLPERFFCDISIKNEELSRCVF